MKNKNTKLSIYIELDGSVDYHVNGVANQAVYNFDHDPKQRQQIRVRVNQCSHDSHLQIKKITLGDVELKNLPQWSYYLVDGESQPKHTYGYMSQPGTYVLNIHANALSHNYMSYFLSLCNE